MTEATFLSAPLSGPAEVAPAALPFSGEFPQAGTDGSGTPTGRRAPEPGLQRPGPGSVLQGGLVWAGWRDTGRDGRDLRRVTCASTPHYRARSLGLQRDRGQGHTAVGIWPGLAWAWASWAARVSQLSGKAVVTVPQGRVPRALPPSGPGQLSLASVPHAGDSQRGRGHAAPALCPLCRGGCSASWA